jgi:diacylglycerol kinase (ATP)
MKQVQLIHNPGAGDENHSSEDLKDLLEENGYKCNYVSTKKKGWKDFEADADILLVAGGDGTIRKVAGELLEARLLDKPNPIALLPMGTANNISKALQISGETKDIIKSWAACKTKGFDVGRIYNIPDHLFFLESFGYGVFPYLMLEMKKLDENEFETPEEKIQKALEVLRTIILSYEPRYCELNVDGTDHSGKFILAEIMNTPSIGPNICISPLSDPGDGEFEVVLVPEQHKEKFAAYVAGKINNQEETYSFHTLKGREIKISWEGTHVHTDDQIVKLDKGSTVKIQLKKGLLEFLVSEP